MANAGPWAPWKVLEFEMPFQGHLKLHEKENFSLKIDQTPWNLCVSCFFGSQQQTKKIV